MINVKHTNKPYMPKAKSDIHETPDDVFDLIEETWGYKKENMFDPCPVDWKEDGLKISWQDLNYVNPPYSKLSEFVYKAIEETEDYDKITIMLLPSKTDQKWFHSLISFGYEMIWIKGRLKFKNDIHRATQPHFLVRLI